MEILHKYLQELNRWKKQVNDLSDDSISKLKKSGVAKSAEEFRKGVEKGTENILKKSNAVKKRSLIFRTPSTRQSFSKSGHYVINDPIGKTRTKKLLNLKNDEEYKRLKPYIDRHEADEARYSKKIKNKTGVGSSSRIINKDHKINVMGKDHVIYSDRVGNHKSLGVLKKEKELTDFANKMYGDAKQLRDIRKNTGEYELVKNKTYKQINKMDKKSAKEALKTIYNKFHSNKNLRSANKKNLHLFNKLRKTHYKYAVPSLKIGGGVLAVGGGGLLAKKLYDKYKTKNKNKEKK